MMQEISELIEEKSGNSTKRERSKLIYPTDDAFFGIAMAACFKPYLKS